MILFTLIIQKYIALKHTNDDNYDLVELYTQETIPLSQFEQEKQDYIINYLRLNQCFICYATQDDLPLLMNILEEMEQLNTEFDFDDIDDEMFAKLEEQDMARLAFCHNVELEFEHAHRFDEGNPAMITQLAMESYLKERIPYLLTQGEDSKVCYYMQVILKNKNVEDLYLQEKDDRQYIIEAYYKLSTIQDGFDIEPIRTASPIINQEVLKRKFLTK